MKPNPFSSSDGVGSSRAVKNRRSLSSEQARRMVRVREARRAYRRFHVQCFWSYRPDLVIGLGDVEWVVEQLMRHGGHEAWFVAARLRS